MADYSRQIATAQRLIAKYGAACTWITSVEAAPNADTPHIPGNVTETQHSVLAAVFPFDDQIRQTMDLRGRDVPQGSQYALMGQVDFSPAVTDLLRLPDGTDWRVMAIKELNPDNTGVILYTVLLQQ